MLGFHVCACSYLHDGQIFDSQHAKGRKPLAFRFGAKQIIPGLEEVRHQVFTCV
jgi:FKBP-type peptidyl-prolyl cis-trans isomerase 2